MGSVSPYELFFRVPPEFQDPLKANSISESMLNEKIQALKEIRQLRYDSIEHRLKERLEKSQIREGGLVRLLNITRTDKQTPNYLPNTFKIVKLHNHLVMLEDVDNPNVTHRVHIDRIKPIHQITSSVVNHLRPKHLEMLGQDPNLARATSSVSHQSEHESLNDESDSDDDPNDATSNIVIEKPEKPIIPDKVVEKTKTTKSVVRPSSTPSVLTTTKLKDPLKIVPITKTVVTGPKDILIPVVTSSPVKKAVSRPPSTVSVQPSDSISQGGKVKSVLAKAAKDMSNLFKKLSPPKKEKDAKKSKAQAMVETPVKYIKAEKLATILQTNPLDTANLQWPDLRGKTSKRHNSRKTKG
jgi:hypothetical protein